MVNRYEGSITVFLSLVGIIIMALLGTLLETARFTMCANHGRRCLRTAVNGLMTEYSRPLYKNYNLFFIEDKGKPFKDVISKYAGHCMGEINDKTKFNLFRKDYYEFFEGMMTNLNIKSKFYASDNKAYGLEKEIGEFMKNNMPKEFIGELINKSKSFDQAEKNSKELEEEIEEEKELAKLDNEMIKLIEKVDGIRIESGKVRCKKEFVKMFVVKDLKSQSFGINHNKVWEEVKKHLDKTPKDFSKMNFYSFKTNVKKVLDITKDAISIANRIKAKHVSLIKLNSKSNGHDKYFNNLIANFGILDSNKIVLEKTLECLKGNDKEKIKQELENIWKDYNTTSLSFEYSGIDEFEEAENPFDILSDSWSGGILSLVCENAKKISSKKIKNSDNYSKLYKDEKEEDFDSGLNSFVKNDDVMDKEVKLYGGSCHVQDRVKNEFYTDAYILKEFSNYTNVNKKKDWKQSLSYQGEYILTGNSCDKKNFESVVNRILLIRTALNIPLLLKDEEKKAESYGLAAALVGFTGMEPLVRLTQLMILTLWAMVEGLVDVAGILQGRDVPIVKKEIYTSFPELFLINGPSIRTRAEKFPKEKTKSFGYKEYLTMFLVSLPSEIKLYRIMDLIDCDMKRNGYIFFEMGKCVYELEVESTFSFNSKFFSMQGISNILNRQIGGMSYNCYLRNSYI